MSVFGVPGIKRGPIILPDWPNEPAGSTIITDYAFSDVIPYPAAGEPLSDGWGVNNGFSAGRADRVTEGSEPFSSPYSCKMTYPTGFGSSTEPANLFHGLGGTDNLYMGMRWKVSDPWQYEAATNKMIFYFLQGDGQLLFMYFQSDRLLKVHTGLPSDVNNYTPNVNSTPFVLGTWNLVEWLCVKSPSTLKWWLNGQLQGSYTSVVWPSENFAECDIAPTWGGPPGDTKTEDDYYWYDHIRLSHT